MLFDGKNIRSISRHSSRPSSTKLEAGDLPLEESLMLFEKGVALSRECRERLNEAERRIEILMKDSEGKPAVSDSTRRH